MAGTGAAAEPRRQVLDMRISAKPPLAGAAHALVGALSATDRGPELQASSGTRTPSIEHLIVIVGENRSFDHLFGVYLPPSGAPIRNLWSQGIVMADGAPDPTSPKPPRRSRKTGFRPFAWTSQTPGPPRSCPAGLYPPPGQTRPAPARPAPQRAIPDHPLPALWRLFGEPRAPVLPNVAADQRGTHGPLLPGSRSPRGRVRRTGSAAPFPDCWDALIPLGFYNMAAGDAPFLKALADRYALADNYHQSIMGGSGANFVALVTGDAAWLSQPDGTPAPRRDRSRSHWEGNASGAARRKTRTQTRMQPPRTPTGTGPTAIAGAPMCTARTRRHRASPLSPAGSAGRAGAPDASPAIPTW